MTLFHAIPVDRGDETIRAALAATINRARANNLSPENWSLAELHLGEQDLEWLQNWARALDETTAGSWLSPEGAQATLAVRPAAIGVLLLLLTAEQARRSTAGENAWAAACTTCFNEPVRRLLFNRTEPSQLYLGALTQAAQRLHVRLIGDWKTREAERQNIALQIALTEADLPERWPQWLQSDAPPEHIARLLDPVTGSHSFQQLWQTCRDFQRGKIAEAELRAALLNNPWILPRWADSIIAALKPRKQPKVQTAPKPSLPAPLPTEDIFDSLTPYGGVKTIIRAARALLARADRLGLRGSAWSLAELRPTEFDYLWLKIWAKRLQLPTVWFCTETRRDFSAGNENVSFRAALGALLLLWLAENARRNAIEGELWTFVALDQLEQPVAAELFRKNQPSRFLREAMATAARELGLRHVLDENSDKCWLDTVYLQFGFTQQGIKQQLPDWLAGQATTRALRTLLDAENGSADFRQLWQALGNFKQGEIAEEQLRELAANSAWILAEWPGLIDDLVVAAQKPSRLEEFAATDAPATPETFLTAPQIISSETPEPQFVCRIAANLEQLQLTEESYEIVIAGKRRARLLRQADGSYLAEPSREIRISSSLSCLAAVLISESGRVAASCKLVLRPNGENAEDAGLVYGAAQLTPQGWRVLSGNETLTLHEAHTSLFKIKMPRRRDSRGEWLKWVAMEGQDKAKPLNGHDAPLDSLSGLGAPLTARSGPFNNSEDEFQLAAAVIDRGLIEAAVCESLPSTTGQLNTGKLTRTSRVLRLKLSRRLEPCENHFVVWWNENGEVGKLLPHYCDDGEDGYWWVCKIPDSVSRFIAVAIARNGLRLGAWCEDDWAELLPPVGDQEPLLTAALLRWFRLPVLSREALQMTQGFSRQYAAASLVAWLKGIGLPEWLRNDPPDKWSGAVRAIFRLWWPEADMARQVLLALADARITDRLNDEMLEVARMLCRVDPLLLAALLKTVKDRMVICSPTEIRLRLAGCETNSAYEDRKQRLIAAIAEAFGIAPSAVQTDLLDCAERWLSGYELRSYERCNLALAAQVEDARLLIALHLLEQI
ncbi:MAG TPA: hypothetical protein PKA34_30465 [Blastocatellia bacterium]|nr:hypothetical protein [Blastocatellia bacterium]HNG32761.1 hypothetical protein [Blastocatellia bacterium]